MVIFRENSEDIYAGIEWEAGSEQARKVIAFLQNEMGVRKIRFPDTSGIGIKPVSKQGTQRTVRKAIQYAIDNDKPSVTLVHKGNIMKYTGVPSATGAMNWPSRSSAPSWSTAARGASSRTRRPAATSSSRTPSPMPSCSRSCCVRPVLGDRDAEPERRLYLRRAGGRWAASASLRVPTCRTRWPCSRPRTVPRRSMPARTT